MGDATFARRDRDDTLEELRQMKAGAKRLDTIFDAEWNDLLMILQQDNIDLATLKEQYESYRNDQIAKSKDKLK